ncbi:MAG: hypothetical protein OEY98_15905 [Acidimicrobiia bacterium]|nr:hypothetical protein [Acidimicrobiia bacterium]
MQQLQPDFPPAPVHHLAHLDRVSRPFASVDRLPADRAEMVAMVRDLCLVLDGINVSQHDPEGGGWSKRVILTESGLERPDRPATVVGFFGLKRRDASDESVAAIDEMNDLLIDRFSSFPPVRGYVSRVLADETNYANLVVMDNSEAIGTWRSQLPHTEAAGVLSESFYANVRIYNGHLAAGFSVPDAMSLRVAKYWDYRTDPHWKAIRQLVD